MAEEPKPGEEATPPSGVNSEQVIQLTQTVTDLAGIVQGLQGKFDTLSEHLANPAPAPTPTPAVPSVSSADLETMSRTDFAEHLMNQVVGRLQDDIIKPLTQKVGAVEEDTEKTKAQRLIDRASGEHKDFWDWKEEIGEEIRKNPYSDPEDAYLLVRAKNPDKASEMDKKYNPPEEEPEGDKPKGFGGLTPTSGQTAPSENMTRDEAAEAAWNDTMAALEASGEG